MGRSWGFINWRWVTIRCPDNLFCPTQCGGSVSLLMGRMMTQLMPSWRGLTQHKQQRLNWCHQGGELAQTQTAKIQLMLSRYVDSPNTSSWTRSDNGEITDIVCGLDTWMTNESCSLRLTTACFDICAVVTTSGQSPHPFHCHQPHCWLAKLHFILWTAPSALELPICGLPNAWNLFFLCPDFCQFYFILFCQKLPTIKTFWRLTEVKEGLNLLLSFSIWWVFLTLRENLSSEPPEFFWEQFVKV